MIYNHNNNLIDKALNGTQFIIKLLCTCRNKDDCPAGKMCNSGKVVYQATIFSMGEEDSY